VTGAFRAPTRVFADPDLLADAAADLFVQVAAESILARGVFRVALAGGTTPERAHRRLASEPRRAAVDWARVDVFFGDERCVAAGSPERNDLAARASLLDHVPVPPRNVHPIEAEAPDGAERYEALILREFETAPGEIPRFDLIFLGLGPDGHTASLFPGHPALAEAERIVIRIDGSPKPPPERITFTLPLLNAARTVAFLAAGPDKRGACTRARQGDPSVPAGRVRPGEGRLLWLIDEAAA
jgi:6-phosphogluconolactonase